ncbi:Tc5 transposase DNA-binding domain-containing protein [Hirsutella rhossiliensis]
MEARILEAMQYIGDVPDAKVANVARQFGVPRNRLRYRLEGRPPKVGRPATNMKLSRPEEAALCRYIDRLDNVNLAVRPEFVTDAANNILRERSGQADLVIGSKWTSRFLKRHGYFKKLQKKSSTRSVRHRRTSQESPIISKISSKSSKRRAYHLKISGIWTRQDFALELARIS